MRSHVYSGFDAVVLALPAPQAHESAAKRPKPAPCKSSQPSQVAPCWTLMLAYPQAVQPGLTTLGPQWNAARSTHHRIAWLARESSKPGRTIVERWTVQASAAWSQNTCKTTRACKPSCSRPLPRSPASGPNPPMSTAQRWRYAKTTRPGQEPSVGRQSRPRRLRRLVPGPPGGRRLCVRPGAGTGRGPPPLTARVKGQREATTLRQGASPPRPPARCTPARWWRRWPAGSTPGPRRPVAGAHGRRGHPALRARGGPKHILQQLAACGLHSDEPAGVAIRRTPLYQQPRWTQLMHQRPGLPLRLLAQRHRSAQPRAAAAITRPATPSWCTPAPAARACTGAARAWRLRTDATDL
jgi:hypothetical protein